MAVAAYAVRRSCARLVKTTGAVPSRGRRDAMAAAARRRITSRTRRHQKLKEVEEEMEEVEEELNEEVDEEADLDMDTDVDEDVDKDVDEDVDFVGVRNVE